MSLCRSRYQHPPNFSLKKSWSWHPLISLVSVSLGLNIIQIFQSLWVMVLSSCSHNKSQKFRSRHSSNVRTLFWFEMLVNTLEELTVMVKVFNQLCFAKNSFSLVNERYYISLHIVCLQCSDSRSTGLNLDKHPDIFYSRQWIHFDPFSVKLKPNSPPEPYICPRG